MRRALNGFTYVEMLVALALVALIGVLLAPTVRKVQQRAQEQALREALREIRNGIDAYKKATDEGRVTKRVGDSGYPPRLVDLVVGVPDASRPNGPKWVFLRRLPADPLFPRNIRSSADDLGNDSALPVPPERTWGLRSYSSPPDSPAPGADVFDVFSLNPGLALDGTRYRDW
jgi:general secretion pathway protein G